MSERLTEKQEEFCRLRASGLSTVKAYMRAYPQSNKQTADKHGHELLRMEKIKNRISELRRLSLQRAASEIAYAKKDAFDGFEDIKTRALDDNDLKTALKAEELKAKLMGLFVEKTEITGGVQIIRRVFNGGDDDRD